VWEGVLGHRQRHGQECSDGWRQGYSKGTAACGVFGGGRADGAARRSYHTRGKAAGCGIDRLERHMQHSQAGVHVQECTMAARLLQPPYHLPPLPRLTTCCKQTITAAACLYSACNPQANVTVASLLPS
jgi:hypothetical protein